MMTMDDRTPKEDLLVGGLYEPAYASWVCASASLAGIHNRTQLRTFSIGLIAEVLVEGLMIAGDYDRDGHHPWRHSPGEAIERITREWLTEWRDDTPPPGAIVWLANTEEGNRIGRTVLAREENASSPF
jgi:hypothetical protein